MQKTWLHYPDEDGAGSAKGALATFAYMAQEWRNVGRQEDRYTSVNFFSDHAAMSCRAPRSASRLSRLSRLAASCLVLAASSVTSAFAFGSFDPLGTEAQLPPRPRLDLPERPSFVPCQAPATEAAYGVVEIVDLALCRNPKTHAAWASARVQAAQVGSALGDYLPSLDGKAVANRVHVDGGNSANQRNAALTLSWLLYDFGARGASLENARQLLSAASHSLDATVQSVFLAALQGYYNAQAARAAVDAARESEKASHESLIAAEQKVVHNQKRALPVMAVEQLSKQFAPC